MKYWGMLLIALCAVTAFAGSRRMAQRRFDVIGHVRRADAYVYPSGLISYWSMDSRSGDDVTVYDTFGSNDGTAVNAPAFGTDYGKYLEGVDLNGSSQYIRWRKEQTITTNEINMVFSVALWCKLDVAGGGAYITWAGEGAESSRPQQLFSILQIGGGFEFNAHGGQGTYPEIIGEYVHLALVTPTATNLHGYVNGNLVVDVTTTGIRNPADNAAHGARARYADFSDTGAAPLDGSLDEIAIFDRALTATEIGGLYNNGAGRFYTP